MVSLYTNKPKNYDTHLVDIRVERKARDLFNDYKTNFIRHIYGIKNNTDFLKFLLDNAEKQYKENFNQNDLLEREAEMRNKKY